MTYYTLITQNIGHSTLYDLGHTVQGHCLVKHY